MGNKVCEQHTMLSAALMVCIAVPLQGHEFAYALRHTGMVVLVDL
jgi:hypothetical protein